MTSIFALLAVCVAMVAGYPSGPPIGDFPTLCAEMVPNHGVDAQTGDAPYEYVMSTPKCYKEGMEIKVAIKSTSDDADAKYFEGFFTQVQKQADTSANFGTFATEDSEYSKARKCFNVDNSTIAHQKESHFDTRVFTWTAPATGQDDLVFRSTLVKSKETFWVNVYSDTIAYDAACTAGEFTDTNTMQEGAGSSKEGTTPGSSEVGTGQAPSILPGILTALATLLSALLL